MSNTDGLYIGLMSGTSADAIDAALVQCGPSASELVCTHEHPLDADIRQAITELTQPGYDEINRTARLDRRLGHVFAAAVDALLSSANTDRARVRAIGSHGQTIRHCPPSAAAEIQTAFTLQIADPNTIAELTGITTVADFRRRDIAAGGEGAPLAPAFHSRVFSAPDQTRAIINIGGIANISLLRETELISGFDSGPGNTLMDQWHHRHRGQAFDRNGEWAAGGQIDTGLLEQLLGHPYLTLKGPRSTGREAFHLQWLDDILKDHPALPPQHVQTTLAEFTAKTIAAALVEGLQGESCDAAFICGGGAHNEYLMQRLRSHMAPTSVATTAALGIDPDWVEAVTFAWLAYRTLTGATGNAPQVTGAEGERIVGGIYAA